MKLLTTGNTKFFVDYHLDCHGTTNRLFRWSGDRPVVCASVKTLPVVERRQQSLQSCSDFIKVDFNGMKGPSRGLDMVLEHLTPPTRSVDFAQCHRPNAAGNANYNRVLRVHTVREEEASDWRDIIDIHPEVKKVF